jgi:flagella basal body P-ring formation protein FlgA
MCAARVPFDVIDAVRRRARTRVARATAPMAVLLCLVCAMASGRADEPVQDLEAVRAFAERFGQVAIRDLGPAATLIAQPLDVRLRLAPCPRLEAFVPAGMRLWGRSGVGVRCAGTPGGWTVTVTVQVRVPGVAVWTARPVQRGVPIVEADLAPRETDLATLPPGIVTDPAAALGRHARTALAAGVPLRAEMVKGPDLVTAGQTVTLTFAGDGFSIGAEGRALGHGAEGDTVRIRTPSGRVISGRVIGPGAVEVR